MVCAVADYWTSEATPESPLSAEDRESFDFLMQLGPHFTLRYDDASTLLVRVAEARAEGLFFLTAAEAGTAEPTGTRHAPHQ
ncbi:hypothetical protein [Streptomyces sp. G-5]|uniref:hypothetical protein n=1 Tax=Streptomyces sp. G-5 TaxID=2977231 RepID=UPI0021CE2D34|nr:hypothetical protein [Streptomyces sp. G-5]MCU4749912.1 hypothetical protein [Streptomyces sp. G-5]